MTDRNRIVKRVLGLIRLAAKNSGATPGERENAKSLASKMIAEHSISIREVSALHEEQIAPRQEVRAHAYTMWTSGNGTNNTARTINI